MIESKAMNALTTKQELFVTEYLKDLNATQAAIRAGYSAKTAEQMGYQLLQKNSVKTTIDKAIAARTHRIERTADEILRDLADIAQTAKAAYFENPDKPALAGAALKALELEGKHHGLFRDKVEVTGKNGKPLGQSVLNIHGIMTLEQLEALGRGLGAVDDNKYDLDQ